jgi:pectin methylesterase-like acyl-CoA thioesterase
MDDYSGKTYSNGQKDAVGKTQFSTYNSYTLLVDAPDIILENLTIVNSAGRVGQAVALHVEGDRFVCKNCTLWEIKTRFMLPERALANTMSIVKLKELPIICLAKLLLFFSHVF